MKLSIIMPTISGREESLEKIVAAYCATTEVEHELIVVKDEPTWPGACNKGYKQSSGETVHFGADDLEPLPGWWEKPLHWLGLYDELPAAKILNFSADGTFDNWEDGEDGAFVHFTRVPILRRDQYERIGFWPEIDYYADIWLSEKARMLGIQTRILYSYAFVHHWSQIGRVDTPERLDAANWRLNNLRKQMV